MSSIVYALRPASLSCGSEDLAFLCGLFVETRRASFTTLGFEETMIEKLLEQQFEAQLHQQCAMVKNDANTSFCIIEAASQPIGKLVVGHWTTEIRLIDIALLPAWRGCGIGGRILRKLIAESEAAVCPIRLHVDQTNHAAHRLYRRLGFECVGNDPPHDFMERLPHSTSTSLPLQTP